MPGPEIVTFGCRLNAYESEVMRDAAQGLGDSVIFNSCAVTAEAVRQLRQAIRRTRRARPDARLVVTGCAAQIDPQAFADMPEVDAVLGNAEKRNRASWQALAREGAPRIAVNDIMGLREQAGHMIDGFADKARAFIEIQNGCDHRCTFCIIPYGRGNSRSVPAGAVVDQVRRLVDQGYREVVLTGVDLTSYGPDLPGRQSLGTLVQQILAHVADLPRLRLSSIDSIEADGALIEAIVGDERLMPHLHLSLQSGDDMILKRMKRRHSRDDAIAFCQQIKARRPDMLFGADLIAGFPTESEAMFDNTLALVEECSLAFLHVFAYSERAGTPAARMPQLPVPVRKERAARLRRLGTARRDQALHQLVGRQLSVLVERRRGDQAYGHSAEFAPVRIAGAAPVGTIVTVRAVGLADGVIDGDGIE